MSPGGHLVTTIAACSAAATITGSLPLTAGIAVGGFLIDIDHAVDYVFVDRQREFRPSAFLRYYLEGRAQRAVLALHSYELFAVLSLVAWWTASSALWGYLAGGVMHLALDIVFNGEFTPRSICAFYSFTYRLAHGFDFAVLFGGERFSTPGNFWLAFFGGADTPDRSPATVHLDQISDDADGTV